MKESKNFAASRADDLIRGLFMLLFLIAARVALPLVGAIAVFQLIYVLIARKPNERVRDFGKDISRYFAEIVRFLSYGTDRKPWPFSPWPSTKLEEETIDINAETIDNR